MVEKKSYLKLILSILALLLWIVFLLLMALKVI